MLIDNFGIVADAPEGTARLRGLVLDLAFQGRLRERERGLLSKIVQALRKIDGGIYGDCESCGEAIGLKRIQARPVAELCIDCKSEQEQLERREG